MKKTLFFILIAFLGIILIIGGIWSFNVSVGNTNKINQLNKDNSRLGEEVEMRNDFIANLDDMLKCTYYGKAWNKSYEEEFTAFSLRYCGKYYLITAGHNAHFVWGDLDTGVFTDFELKANMGDIWIHPKLLSYRNDFAGSIDWAILVSDKLTDGFNYSLSSNQPTYVLGNGQDNILKEFSSFALVDGESGSPVVNLNGEVVGIATGGFTDIDLVIDALRKEKK